jgi:hypothetical protein
LYTVKPWAKWSGQPERTVSAESTKESEQRLIISVSASAETYEQEEEVSTWRIWTKSFGL